MRVVRLLSSATCIAAMACASGGSGANPSTSAPTTTQTVRVSGSGSPGGDIAIGMNPEPSVSVKKIPAPVADVWRVLPEVFADFSIPLTTLDPASKTIGNAGFNLRRRLGSIPLVRLIDCGSTQGGPSADSYDIKMSVVAQARADDAGNSTLIITVEASGRPVAFSGEFSRCSTTGSLENRMADAVRKKLAK